MLRSRHRSLGATRVTATAERLPNSSQDHGLLRLPNNLLLQILGWTCPRTLARFAQCAPRCLALLRGRTDVWWAVLPQPVRGWLLDENLAKDSFGPVSLEHTAADAAVVWVRQLGSGSVRFEQGFLHSHVGLRNAVLGLHLTVAAWVRLPADATGRMCVAAQALPSSSGGPQVGWALFLDMRAEAICCLVGTQVFSSGNVPICDGRWHLVAFTLDEESVCIHLDGARCGRFGPVSFQLPKFWTRAVSHGSPACPSSPDSPPLSSSPASETSDGPAAWLDEWEDGWSTGLDDAAGAEASMVIAVGGFGHRPEHQFRGCMKHVLVWDRTLTATDLSGLWCGVGTWRLDAAFPMEELMDDVDDALCEELLKEAHRPKRSGMALRSKKAAAPAAAHAAAPHSAVPLVLNFLDS
eukprot:GGOE01061714.1.p1 GENE.GGOE01061714.1~~GGOE01061714.1.p1  ORF type:complete len:409 (-),score=90.44 GGOE01061714.1:133-1359(-)